MKLTIPKPVVESDSSCADSPDFSNEGSYPNVEREIPHEWPIGPATPDDEIKRLILEDCRAEGLVTGAVVVHKRVLQPYRLSPLNWGFIIRPNSPTTVVDKWKPLCVRWVSGSYEDCFPIDLILLMNVPDKQVLLARVKNGSSPAN